MGLEPLQNPQRGLCRELLSFFSPPFFFTEIKCACLVAERGREKKKFEGRKLLWQWFPKSCQEVCEVQIRLNLNLNIDVDAEVCLHNSCDGRAGCSL